MATKSLTFDIFGRDRSASSTIRGVGDEADRTSGRFKNFGIAAGIAIAAVAGAAIKFGTDSVQAFAEAEESQNRLAFAYEKFPALADTNIDAMRRLNEELATKTRYDDDAYAVGQAQLAQYGLTGQQIMDLTPLLADYAGKTGKDLPAAAEDLGKALLGQGRALKDIGIDFADTGSVAGNFDSIMQGLRDQVGGFASQDAETAAGKLDIMKNKFGELQEAVGAELIDPLSDAMDELSDSGAVEDMGTALAGVVQGFTDLEEKTGFLSDFASDLGDVKQMFDDISAASEAFGSGDLGKIGDWFGQEFGQGGIMGSIFGGEWMKNPPLPPLPESMRQMFEDTTAEAEAGSENTRRGMGGGFSAAAIDNQAFRDAQTSGFAGMWGAIDGGTATGLGGVNATTGAGLGAVGLTLGGLSPVASGAFGAAWSIAQAATGSGWAGVHGSTSAGMGTAGSILGGFRGIVQGQFAGAGAWLISAGGSIVQGLVGGISSMVGSAARAAADLAASVVQGAKSALGIKSPSRVFRDEVGKQIGAGLALGILAQEGLVSDAVDHLTGVPGSVAANAAGARISAIGGASSGGAAFPSTVVLRVGEREFTAYVDERATSAVSGYEKETSRASSRGSSGF